jgi:hypothetical protein
VTDPHVTTFSRLGLALLALLLGRLLGVVAALVFRILSGHRQVFAFSLGHELVLSDFFHRLVYRIGAAPSPLR